MIASKEAPVLIKVGPLEFRQAAVSVSEPIHLVQGRTRTEKRIASLWNNYGREIAFQARNHGIPVEVALAVFATEAGSRAYDAETGLVIIRYEPHVFRRKTGKACPAQRGGQSAEWENLARAAAIDPEAACWSVSWGLPQLMGFNHGMTQFPSAIEMALGFQTSILHQVSGFFRFVEKRGLVESIHAEDWEAFTRGYNGSGQVENYSGVLTSNLAVARTMQNNGAVFGS